MAGALNLSDGVMVRIAREVAIDHFDIETILKRYSLTVNQWDQLRAHPRFTSLLESQISEWQSAENTPERVKLKAAALMELWLEEANTILHDKLQPLNGRVELGKLIARIAGIGLNGAHIEGGTAEKFSVTINLGNDAQLKFEKPVAPKVIEGRVEDYVEEA